MLITNAPRHRLHRYPPVAAVEHLEASHLVLPQDRQRAVVGVGARPQLPGSGAVSRAG